MPNRKDLGLEVIEILVLSFKNYLNYNIHYLKHANDLSISYKTNILSGFFNVRAENVVYELGTMRNCETVVIDSQHA